MIFDRPISPVSGTPAVALIGRLPADLPPLCRLGVELSPDLAGDSSVFVRARAVSQRSTSLDGGSPVLDSTEMTVLQSTNNGAPFVRFEFAVDGRALSKQFLVVEVSTDSGLAIPGHVGLFL